MSSSTTVTRRRVLMGAGAVATLGLASHGRAGGGDRLTVRIWLSEAAADHSLARERAASYLRRALADAGYDPTISFGEPPQRFTAGDRAVERIAWPTRVLAGAGGSSVEPVSDVNLLITDGNVAGPTAGYAYPRIASVPGARFLAAVDPVEESPLVVEYTVPAAVTQLLLHEVGHTLGLDHNHGAVIVDEATVTVTPMVSGYAWAAAADRPADLAGGGCGADLPAGQGRRRLAMTYSRCAARALRSYRGPQRR